MTSGFVSSAAEPRLALATSSQSAEPARRSRPAGPADPGAASERRFRRILLRKQQQGDLSGMAACYIHLGDLLLSRGDSEEAGEHYRQALSLSRQAHERRQALARP